MYELDPTVTSSVQRFERLRYDATAIPLVSVVAAMLEVEDLTTLTCDTLVTRQMDDQRSVFHRRYFDHVDQLHEPYCGLLDALGLSPDEVLVQRIPTLRVQSPGSLAVGAWHRDMDYGHHPAEINYWVPLTPLCPDNTLWIEDEPVLVDVGEVVRFRGATARHGNVVNRANRSRVSIDFRTLDPTYYSPGVRSVSHGVEFRVGKYWWYSGRHVRDDA
ncbi:MAG: hypothetical protein QOK43_2181 [Acidimicrobiaceae bacterium]|nr:hypothetical protein [Acidimicrobiaceae bacterium]